MPTFVPLDQADAEDRASSGEAAPRFVPLAEADKLPDTAPAAQKPLPEGVTPSEGRGQGFDDPRLLAPRQVADGAPGPSELSLTPSSSTPRDAEPSHIVTAEPLKGAVPSTETPLLDSDRPHSVLQDQGGGDVTNVRYSRLQNVQDDAIGARTVQPESQKRGELMARNRSLEAGQTLEGFDPITRGIAKTVTGGAQSLAGVVRAGADQAAKLDVPGARQVGEFARAAGQGATDFETGMGEQQGVPRDTTFGPKSPLPYLARMGEGAVSSIGQSATYAASLGPRAVIPLMSLSQAGQQYQQAREQGMSPDLALANAIPNGTFEAIGEKFAGLDKAAEAMKVLLNRGASQAAKIQAGHMLSEFGFKELPGELITTTGQDAIDKMPGIGLRQDMTMDDFINDLRDTAVQTGMMSAITVGAGHGAAAHAANQGPQKSAEQLAREKGFLVLDEQAKRMKAAGETELAATIQQQANSGRAADELQTLKVKPWADDSGFREHYTQLREQGVAPAEAAARAGMSNTFVHVSGGLGVQPDVAAKAQDAAGKLPIAKVPRFYEAFVAALVKKGLAQPAPEGTVQGAVQGVRDDAIATTIHGVYGEDTPAETMDAITALEGKQAGTPAAGSASEAAPSETQAAVPATNEGQSETGEQPLRMLTPNEAGAHLAHSSPLNDTEASKAQILAGNAPVGRMVLGKGAEGGQADISIENPPDSVRVDLHHEPPDWQTRMEHGYGYGYVRRSEGNDGDHVDAFVKADLPEDYAGPVFVVDQVAPGKSRAFDEHKLVIGPQTADEALQVYNAHYEPGWKGADGVTQLSWPQFKQWVHDGKKTDRLSAPGALAGTSQQGAAVDSAGSPAVAGVGGATAPGAAVAPADGRPGAVGKVEAAPAPAAAPLRLGITPNDASPVTVKDGVVHIGREPALNFDTGEPVTVPEGASDTQIRQALKDAGAVSRRQKFFGGQKAEAAGDASTAAAPSTNPEPPAVDKEARKRDAIELRKRVSVLESLLECVGG